MSIRSMMGWVVFLFLVSILFQALPNPKATYYFFKGKERYSSRNYEAAATAFRDSVNSDPNFARGFVELGITYRTLEKYPEAEQAFKQAMSIEPDSCAACGLGMVYRLQNRRDEAEAALRQSIKLNAKDNCAYNQLGRMYYDEKEYSKAITAFEQETELQPSAVSYHFLANSLHYSKRTKESIAPYLKAINMNPKYEEVLVDLGLAYHELGQYPEAKDALERAVKLDPEDEKARSFLAVTQFITGNKQAAMEQYRWLLKKNPSLAAQLLQGFYELSDTVEKIKEVQKRND
jgi:tetratricopeptide (TPR) repeat protein